MATWVDGLSLTLEVAFANDPYDTSPTWTDISEYLCPWSIQIGRSDESNDFAPGTMSLQLRNDDRRFDPDHASGPYFGDLVPMKPIRLSVTYSAVTHVIFNGFVLGWPQQWGKVVGNAYVNCVDGSRAPENAELTQSAYQWDVEQDDPMVYWPLQDAGSDTIEDFGSNGTNLLPVFDFGLVAASVIEETYPIDAGSYFAGPSGQSSSLASSTATFDEPKAFEAWVSMTEDSSSGALGLTMIQAEESYFIVRVDFLGVYVEYSNVTDNRRLTTLGGYKMASALHAGVHHVALRADTTNMYLIIDGVLFNTQALTVGSTAYSAWTEPRVYLSSSGEGGASHVAWHADGGVSNADLLARYQIGLRAYGHPYGERSGERIERVLDEIGFPSGKRTIATGETIQGPYKPGGQQALDYIRQVEASEQGLFFFDGDGNAVFIDRQQLVAGDTDTTIVLSDDGDPTDVTVAEVRPDGNSITTVRNIVTTSYSSTGAITRRDTTSIGNYLEQRQFIDAPTLPNGRTASLLSAYVLRLRKDPLTRIPELGVSLREDVANHFQILSLSIGDVVTFQWTPMNIGSALSKRLMVQGIRIDGNEEDIRTTLYLSPAVPSYTEVPYLTLGDATYGQIGATAGNLIPY